MEQTMNRAYSILNIKSADKQTRTIKGVATTPTPDRMGDVIEPLGVKFKNPMPLLWQHKSDKPIGQVSFKKPTKDGIDFEAILPDVSGKPDNSEVRKRVEEAWDSIELGLVGAVSIGFKAIEYNFMKDTDGIHFIETEVMELSLVTIPANSEAVISTFKSIDAPMLAASGLEAKDIDRPKRPGVSGKQPHTPPAPKDARKMKIAEQISAYEAKRAGHSARMTELMTKAADQNVTLDAAESEEYDRLEKETTDIDAHLVRLRRLEEANKAAAVEPPKPPRTEHALILPDNARISVKGANAPLGSAFTRLAIAIAYGMGDTMKSIQRAKEWKADMPEITAILEAGIGNIMDGQKAAVGAGTTTDAGFASPLVFYQVMVDQFIQLLRPRTIIGRIPNLRMVPFNIQMPATTTGTSVGWVGENAPKPVSNMAFTTVTMRWAKAAGIVILTQELVRFSNPAAEAVVRGDLVAAMAQFLDRQFVDPAVAAVPNVSPASITNGVTPIVATGTNEAALRADIKSMMQAFLVQNLQLGGGVWIMTQQQALSLSLMINALGQPSFPTITGDGGTLAGYPVVASENLPASGGSPANGYPMIFALASEIMLADDGQTVIDASNQASVQMDTAPDSPPSASSPYVSLWQMNYVGLRAERWINWQKRRTNCVAYIDQAKYG
jgi:HK97 family phage major capsid protein/HK97 family phage prohead protease